MRLNTAGTRNGLIHNASRPIEQILIPLCRREMITEC